MLPAAASRSGDPEKGFTPDLICAGALWGESLYLRELFPKAKILTYLEFFYRGEGTGLDFDKTRMPGPEVTLRLLTKNAGISWSAAIMDWGITSLDWQRDLFPAILQPRISVIHEGIDTERAAPETAKITIDGTGVSLTEKDEVVTFAARFLEKLRGVEGFLQAVPEILARRPKARILVIGSEVDKDPLWTSETGESLMASIRGQWSDDVDTSRIHFIGRLDHDRFLEVLKVSSVHVYLTYPFILSWSMLEAMACGAAPVGSDNPPVTEIITQGENGLLVDFFDPSAIAEAVSGLLADSNRRRALAAAARRTIVERYDLRTVCLPRQLNLIGQLMAGNELGRNA